MPACGPSLEPRPVQRCPPGRQESTGDAAVLLSGSAEVPRATTAALMTLGVDRVVLVGGEAALHPEVADALASEGYEIDRLAGADRYATAAAVAEHSGAEAVGTLDGKRAAVVASVEGFADALAAGPLAAGAQLPLLLTTSEPSAATRTAADAMDRLSIERAVVVGGEAAVNETVVDQLADRGVAVERWAGDTRTETAATVADRAVDRLGFDREPALLARGDHVADALAASGHAGTQSAPLLLGADPDTLGSSAARGLADHCSDIATVRALGGRAALGSAGLGVAAETVEACHDGVGEAFLRVTLATRARWGGAYDGPERVPERVRIDGAGMTEAVMVQDFECSAGGATEPGLTPSRSGRASGRSRRDRRRSSGGRLRAAACGRRARACARRGPPA